MYPSATWAISQRLTPSFRDVAISYLGALAVFAAGANRTAKIGPLSIPSQALAPTNATRFFKPTDGCILFYTKELTLFMKGLTLCSKKAYAFSTLICGHVLDVPQSRTRSHRGKSYVEPCLLTQDITASTKVFLRKLFSVILVVLFSQSS